MEASLELLDPVPVEEGEEGQTAGSLIPNGNDFMNSIVNNQRKVMESYQQ